MNANKIFQKIVFFTLIVITFIGCIDRSSDIDYNTYEILSVITERKIKKYPIKSINNPRNDFEIKGFLKKINSNVFLVAIEPKLLLVTKNFSLQKNKKKNQILFDEFDFFKEEVPLDLDRITTSYSDVKIIKFTNEHLEKLAQRKEYRDFHLLLTFSRISFNKNLDKALVFVGSSLSALAGSYDLCFLEKENGKWKIIGFQNIEIS